MLHNTGPYGPNETPVNMGAPLNISQLSTPMNMAQNLNNLGKMPPQPPQTGPGHFNLPTYPSYGNPPLSVSPQMHPFQNYHSLGFQPSYMTQNPTHIQNTSWQSAMLPMGLNMHGDHSSNMMNYPPIDKRLPQPNSYKEQHYTSKTPINIPQVPNKLYPKHADPLDMTPNVYNDHFKPYSPYKDGHNLDLSMKSPDTLLHDNTRRKNLENTVRLIENILINTTKSRELPPSTETSQDSMKNNTNEDTNNVETESLPEDCTLSKNALTNDKDAMESDYNDDEMDNVNEESDNNDEENEDEESEDDIDDNNDNNSSNKNVKDMVDVVKSIEVTIEQETEKNIEEDVDVKPVIIKREPVDTESQVVVKIEQISSWTDSEGVSPFQRDVHGVMRDDARHGNVIDGDTSLLEAMEVVKNGLTTSCYYECAHCCLLFDHPKRFLIHVKWHTFGLINEQRLEMAREKEERSLLKKEAQQLEKQSKSSKEWPCKNCDKVFYSKSGCYSHRKRYHSNRVRECKICSKTLSGWNAWKTHQATHNTESGFQCNQCPKRFKYSHSLAKHKDTHLEKTHGCPECPKKFGSQALLKVHMKSHERAQKAASFHCTFCCKPFYDKFNLQIHERTHTNERPFVCEICNATFGCNSNLSRHLKVSHSTSKPHVCSSCHRSFATALIRDRHEMRMHGDPEEFKYTCKQCPSRYMKMVDLRKHTYKMHPKPKKEPKSTK